MTRFQSTYKTNIKNEYVEVWSKGLDMDDMLSNLELQLVDVLGEPYSHDISYQDLTQSLQYEIMVDLVLKLARA